MELADVSDYRRWLDLRTATLHRTLTWRTRSGAVVAVRFTRFMDPALRFVCVQTCELEGLSGQAHVQMTSVVDNDVRTNGVDKFAETRVGRGEDGLIYSDITTNIGNRVVTASRMWTEADTPQTVEPGARRITATAAFDLAQGQRVLVVKASAVIADAYFGGDLLGTASDLLARVAATPMAELRRSHEAEWARRWAACDVEMDADDPEPYNSQLAMRQAVYHLLRAKGESEPRNLVDPKGMSGDLYYGAAFWDMEIFINPFYIYTQPDTGRDTPMYRANHLDKARALARSYGYNGARYPWMQAPDGDPVTTMWHYGDHQIHITADVIVGMWHYVRATGDRAFLYDHGVEMVVETARYWRERVDTVAGRPGHHIYGVMGPDEYKPLTNNNAYTNYTAAYNLRLAGAVVRMMAEGAPEKLAALRAKLHLTDDELAAFQTIADGLVIPRDEARGIIWQCDDFDTAFVDLDIDAIWTDRTVLFGKYLSQEHIFRSKALKQSDVVALMGVFPTAFTHDAMAASFDYYKRYNIHDSSNSMCHHMIVAAALGRADEAYEAWLRSLDIDFAALPRSADGVHCANVGGMWQEVVFGFAGLLNALCADELTFQPCLPAQIRRIAFRLVWQGAPVRVVVTQTELWVENLSDREIVFHVGGQSYQVGAGGAGVAALPASATRRPPPSAPSPV
jgi:kojibiose phosphorylase